MSRSNPGVLSNGKAPGVRDAVGAKAGDADIPCHGFRTRLCRWNQSLVSPLTFVEGQSGCKSRPWGSGLQQCEFAQRGWRGELFVGDNEYRNDRFGDWVKRPAVKSSTMRGSIENERKSLPVRFRGDGAESRKSVQERYSQLLLS